MIPSHWRPFCPPFPSQAQCLIFSNGHRLGPPGWPPTHNSQTVWGLPAILPPAPSGSQDKPPSPSLGVLMVGPSPAGNEVWGSYRSAWTGRTGCGQGGQCTKILDPGAKRGGRGHRGSPAQQVRFPRPCPAVEARKRGAEANIPFLTTPTITILEAAAVWPLWPLQREMQVR